MHADIVVRFAPIEGRNDPPDTPLSAELMLRPTIRHPDLSGILDTSRRGTIHLKLTRDEVELIWTIDRSEVHHHVYVLRDGQLVRTPNYFEIPGWRPDAMEQETAKLDNPKANFTFEYGRPMKPHGWQPFTNADLVRMMDRFRRSRMTTS